MSTTIVILISSLALGQQPAQFSVSRGYVVKRGEVPASNKLERIGELANQLSKQKPVPEQPRPSPKVEQPRASMTYEEARARALETARPLVIGVGCPPPPSPVDSWDIIRVNELLGYQAPCIVVTAPLGGELVWVATMQRESSAFDVARRLNNWTVPPSEEERRGILPKSRERWNPYNQPDFQGRMRRREVSVIRPLRSGPVFGGRIMSRSRSANC